MQTLLGAPSLQSLEANVLVVRSRSVAHRVCSGNVSSVETPDTGTACQRDEDTPADLCITDTKTMMRIQQLQNAGTER